MLWKYMKHTRMLSMVIGLLTVCLLATLTNYVDQYNVGNLQQLKAPTKRNIFFNWTKQRPSYEDIDLSLSDNQSYVNDEKLHDIQELQSLIFPNSEDFNVNCENVLEGERTDIESAQIADLTFRASEFLKYRSKYVLPDEMFKNMTQNCTSFRQQRKYPEKSLTPEENNYPIAYIIIIHKKLSMFERLLRSIYQPQNVYCVHVDAKSKDEFYQLVQRIAQCFPNVFLSTKRANVHYTHWSRVEADLNCFSDLIEKKAEYDWKYVINLCGQDYPLKTNLEIVRSLKTLNGRNNLETVFTDNTRKIARYRYHFELSQKEGLYAVMTRTATRKSDPPISTPMFSGSAYYALKYEAVKYAITTKYILEFFKWNEDTFSPDEHLWATMQRMFPEFPGSIPPHRGYDLNSMQSITRLVKWYGVSPEVYPKCAGVYMREVCVYGAGDLNWLVDQQHLFANKFDDETSVMTMECMDQWLRNKAINQAISYLTRGYS